jgi:DNA polymerase-3 subunit delta'
MGRRGKRTLKINQIRDLEHNLSLTPAETQYKIVILEDFQDANPNATNAFLKTLEEPPAYAVLILTAVDPGLLLPTVPSRCQEVALRPVPADTIQQALRERWGVDEESSHLLSHLADGRIGWAIEAAQDQRLLDSYLERLALLREALRMSRVGRFTMAGKLARDPEELLILLRTWLGWWRDLALVTFGAEDDAAIVIGAQRQCEAGHRKPLTQLPNRARFRRQAYT